MRDCGFFVAQGASIWKLRIKLPSVTTINFHRYLLYLRVKNRQKQGLDFEIDRLTNSIVNVTTNDSLSTSVLPLSNADLKLLTKKNGWVFDWKFEHRQPDRAVY